MKKVRISGIHFPVPAGFASSAQAKIEVEGDVYFALLDKYIRRGFGQSGSKSTTQASINYMPLHRF